MKSILAVIGARPNIIKMAPVIRSLKTAGARLKIVHTGQHYGKALSSDIFQNLQLPKPDINFKIGSGSHAHQISECMKKFESFCLKEKPGLVIVSGDVNSTLACSLVASRLEIPLIHIESGLRSFDPSMPEETNRILTDHLSNLLFVTEASGIKNLKKEGISTKKIHFVGNTMIDSLKETLKKSLALKPWKKFNLTPNNYIVVTLHRPSNVDNIKNFKLIISALNTVQKKYDIIFPVHPRTQKNLVKIKKSKIIFSPPLDYLHFLGLIAKASLIVTDSGGIQEETLALKIPCLTIRENTERPITITCNSNTLVKLNKNKIISQIKKKLNVKKRTIAAAPKWDGRAHQRITRIIKLKFQDLFKKIR